MQAAKLERGFASPTFLAEMNFTSYIVTVIGLTKQEWWVAGIIVTLLLTGLITKTYRASQPALKPVGSSPAATVTIQQARP